MNSYIDYEAAPVDKTFRLDTFCMGAVAGAVSRTATAPVDRLKIFFQGRNGEKTFFFDKVRFYAKNFYGFF